MIADDRTLAPLPEECEACGGTYCCPKCNPVRPGWWQCGGCDGKTGWWRTWNDYAWIPCRECDESGWTPCEDCDGASDGCLSCVPNEPKPASPYTYADDPADRCSSCGDSRVCRFCRPVDVSARGLRVARERAGWSWAEAGYALGVSPKRLKRMEDEDRHFRRMLRGDRAARLAERARLPVAALEWSGMLLDALQPGGVISTDTLGQALGALLALGDEPQEGEDEDIALRRRLAALADGLNALGEGAAAGAIRGLIPTPSSELGTVVADAEDRDRLRRLDQLGDEIHRAESLKDLAPWIGPLFQHDPGTLSAFDRVKR